MSLGLGKFSAPSSPATLETTLETTYADWMKNLYDFALFILSRLVTNWHWMALAYHISPKLCAHDFVPSIHTKRRSHTATYPLGLLNWSDFTSQSKAKQL